MSFWAAVTLIIKNWDLVMRFIGLIEKGVNAAQLKASLDRIEKGFNDAKSVKEAAAAARSINDGFR